MATDPFLEDVEQAGDPFLEDAAQMQAAQAESPEVYPKTIPGYTEKYFRQGTRQMGEGMRGFIENSPLFSRGLKSPFREMSPEETAEEATRPVKAVKGLADTALGATTAAISMPAAIAARTFGGGGALGWLEQQLGMKNQPVSSRLDELIPDILMLFGPAAAAKVRNIRRPVAPGAEPLPNIGAEATPEIPVSRPIPGELTGDELVARYNAEKAGGKVPPSPVNNEPGMLDTDRYSIFETRPKGTSEADAAMLETEDVLRNRARAKTESDLLNEIETALAPSRQPVNPEVPRVGQAEPVPEPRLVEPGAVDATRYPDISRARPGEVDSIEAQIARRLHIEDVMAKEAEQRALMDQRIEPPGVQPTTNPGFKTLEAEVNPTPGVPQTSGMARILPRQNAMVEGEAPMSPVGASVQPTRLPGSPGRPDPFLSTGFQTAPEAMGFSEADPRRLKMNRGGFPPDPNAVTEMHSIGSNIDWKKTREYIKGLPGMEALLDMTAPARSKLFGAKKADQYMTLERERKGISTDLHERVLEMTQGLDKAIAETMKDQRWANAFTKNDARVRVSLALKGDYSKLPKDSPIYRGVQEARDVIQRLQAEKVKHGIIPEESASVQDYVRKLYARDVIGGQEWAKIIPPETRAAGIEYILKNDKIRDGNVFRAPTMDEAKAIAESVIQEGHGGAIGQRLRIPYKITPSQLMKRKDIPPEIRGLMGEIDDGLYLAARTVYDGGNLVAMHDFLRGFAKGSETIKGVSMPWMSEVPRMGYRRVRVNDYTARAFGEKVGNDVFVLEKYAPDFEATFGRGNEGALQTVFDKVYNPLYSSFKAAKTIWNPATWGRNILGNIIFSAGARNSLLNPANTRYYNDAFKALRDRNELYHEAIQRGVMGAEFSAAELKQIANAYYNARGNWMETFKNLAAKPLLDNPVARKLGRFYSQQDQIFKLASYVKQRSLGFSPEEASLHVNKFFPRYDELSPVMQGLTQKGVGQMVGSPFASFAAESVRIGKNMAMEAPIQLALWTFSIPMLTQASRVALGMSQEELRQQYRRIPPELRSPLGTYFLPIKDDKGNIQFIDTTYWHPLGQYFKGIMSGDKASNFLQLPLMSDFVGGNPIMTLAIETTRNVNLSPFKMGEPIVRPSEDALPAYAGHIARTLAPPLAPGGTGMRQIAASVRGVPGRFGQKQSVPEALVGEVTPFRVTPVDAQLASFTQGLQRSEKRRIDEDLRRLNSDFQKGKIKPDEYRNGMRNILEEQRRVIQKFYE